MRRSKSPDGSQDLCNPVALYLDELTALAETILQNTDEKSGFKNSIQGVLEILNLALAQNQDSAQRKPLETLISFAHNLLSISRNILIFSHQQNSAATSPILVSKILAAEDNPVNQWIGYKEDYCSKTTRHGNPGGSIPSSCVTSDCV